MEHHWRTRSDPFEAVWPWVQEQLTLNPGLEAKTVFEWLQREYPARFADGQLRTLQRHVKHWRALHGPAKEVFFSQVHQPGHLGASDFTHASSLQVTIDGQPFPHLIYHFVLTYSNWEAGTVCFAESFESLSDGLQNALAELVPAVAIAQARRLGVQVKRGARLRGEDHVERAFLMRVERAPAEHLLAVALHLIE